MINWILIRNRKVLRFLFAYLWCRSSRVNVLYYDIQHHKSFWFFFLSFRNYKFSRFQQEKHNFTWKTQMTRTILIVLNTISWIWIDLCVLYETEFSEVEYFSEAPSWQFGKFLGNIYKRNFKFCVFFWAMNKISSYIFFF